MPDGLYQRDVLVWSAQQADLLRRFAGGERVNDAIDWENVAEEIESVGVSELRACRSLLRQALMHLLKLRMWPESRSVEHWRDEVFIFTTEARDAFTPSMRQRINVDELYADAFRRVRARIDDSGPPGGAPDACPFTLDDLLAACPDVGALAARLGGAEGGDRA